MSNRYTKRILDHLSNQQYHPVDAHELARQLRVEPDLSDTFVSELGELLNDERIQVGNSDRIQLPPFPSEVEGTIRVTARGFGFVITDFPFREGDLFIPANATMNAISGGARRQLMPWMTPRAFAIPSCSSATSSESRVTVAQRVPGLHPSASSAFATRLAPRSSSANVVTRSRKISAGRSPFSRA